MQSTLLIWHTRSSNDFLHITQETVSVELVVIKWNRYIRFLNTTLNEAGLNKALTYHECSKTPNSNCTI